MAITSEVWSWPECAIYLYPAGGPSAIMVFAESVQGQVDWTWIKFKNQLTGSFAARSNFALADKFVTIQIGQLYYDSTTFLQANSATAFNADFVYSASGGLIQSSKLNVWSAVFTKFGFQSQEGNLWHGSVSLLAADISGV